MKAFVYIYCKKQKQKNIPTSQHEDRNVLFFIENYHIKRRITGIVRIERRVDTVTMRET